ncbi:MAG: drug:proton antiporter [Acidimicrobiaceae bacterium]|nr:drug:proton antiporter [Acidimicrobiaceae bacterium]
MPAEIADAAVQPQPPEVGMPTVHRIVFTPSGLEAQAVDGASVLEVAREARVDLDSVCGGRGVCGRCQITPSFGDFSKWALRSEPHHLSEVGTTEQDYQGRRFVPEGWRLGCQAKVHGPLVVDVPAESQLHAPIIRKEISLEGLALDPVSSLRVVSVRATQVKSVGAQEAINEACQREWRFVPETFDAEVLKEVTRFVGDSDETVTLHLRQMDGSTTVHSVRKGVHVDNLGVAIDLGSTTVAAHLMELSSGEVLASSGLMNPQIRLGEDLMSRVSYVMMNPDGGKELTGLAREAVASLINTLLADTERSAEDLTEVVLVGNPVMHHSFLGFDVVPLGQMPFDLATDRSVVVSAPSLGLPGPHASVYLPPCIAGHVGGDAAAAVLAEAPHKSSKRQLLVDVGTNAEIVFGDENQLYAASSPTGPAFEGAQITHGQRAIPGAIERVRINKDTFEPEIKIIGSELWSSDSGFSELLKKPGVTGICGSGIIEAVGELFLSGLMTAEGVILDTRDQTDRVISEGRTFSYVLHRPDGSDDQDGRSIVISQTDIRAIQLAKAALRAGIDLLLEHAQCKAPDEIRLAGAFGAHIDPVYAMVLGLIPDCPLDDVSAVGNAAGSGAARLLLSGHERRAIEELVKGIEKIETATEERFQALFVDAMSFPHATADYPNLQNIVQVPARPLTSNPASSRRKRRSNREGT